MAMSEAPRNGETQSEREARVLKSVLEADIVPENKLGKVGAQSGKCADDARQTGEATLHKGWARGRRGRAQGMCGRLRAGLGSIC